MINQASTSARITLIGLLTVCAALPAAATYHPKKSQPADLIAAGLVNLDHREYTAAIANFSKAARRRGTSTTYFLLGYAHYQRGFSNGAPESADKQDAIEIVNAYTTALALDPKLHELEQPFKLYHGLAMAYEALGSDEKAMDCYKKAFALAPANPMLPLLAARLRFKMGAPDKSLANLELSLKRAKSTGQTDELVKLIKTSALFSSMLKDPDHQRVLRLYDPATAEAAAPIAMAQAKLKTAVADNLRDAVKNTTPAEQRPTLGAQDQKVLDRIAAGNDEFKFRRYPEAIDAYQEALLLDKQSGTLSPGQSAYVQERIGTALNRLGQTTEAITALQRSAQAMPYNAATHYQLALAYSVSGHFTEALKALRESFKTSPSTGELRKYMLLAKTDSELEGMRDLPAFQAALTEFSERALASRSSAASKN